MAKKEHPTSVVRQAARQALQYYFDHGQRLPSISIPLHPPGPYEPTSDVPEMVEYLTFDIRKRRRVLRHDIEFWCVLLDGVTVYQTPA